MLHWTSGFIKSFISLVSIMFFINHFAYLSVGRFDYQYNMKANILTGIVIMLRFSSFRVYEKICCSQDFRDRKKYFEFAKMQINRYSLSWELHIYMITHHSFDCPEADKFSKSFRYFTGIATGIGWVIWYAMQRKKHSYAWKILLFQFLVAISLLLEVNDFPPLFWVLDAHALWHLSTVLPTVLLYRYFKLHCKSISLCLVVCDNCVCFCSFIQLSHKWHAISSPRKNRCRFNRW